MRVAVIGAGIAGNTAAHRLCRDHDVVLFEARDRIGGHSNTIDVQLGGRSYPVDTGFVVFNHRTYPRFSALLETLGVRTQPSRMSFSVRCDDGDLEYNGTSVNALFAQRSNLVRPAFYRMIANILRFNRDALAYLASPGDAAETLSDFLGRGGYGRGLVEHYVVPMGAAIWSTDPTRIGEFPARAFLRFCANHGLLSVDDRPQWRVIAGGSRRYVEALTRDFRERIRTRAAVTSIRRHRDHVTVATGGGMHERFDAVFLACHSDEALDILADPTPDERDILGAIPYQRNEAVLHTDASLLPRRRLARAAWNCHVPAAPADGVTVTYDMNILQSLDAPEELCVSLNCAGRIDPRRVIARLSYSHPVFTRRGIDAQARHGEISGRGRTYYCGAYWGHGFHEDGVVSALSACDQFYRYGQDEELHIRRAG